MLKIQDGVSIVEKLNGQLALNTNFGLGIKSGISGKKLSKLEKLRSWLRNVVKHGKCSPANFGKFVLRARICN